MKLLYREGGGGGNGGLMGSVVIGLVRFMVGSLSEACQEVLT